MARVNSARKTAARSLEWEFPGGVDVVVELHQMDIATWRNSTEFHDARWHCVPAREPGQLIVTRASLRPRP
jgi:hypothetical protein